MAIDAPPDFDGEPAPDARWSPSELRTGVCGAVAPRIVALREGGYRMYYTQILPRPGFPAGANDYGNSAARILSAFSRDGSTWSPEPGVRLTPHSAGAGVLRVVSSEVVPVADSTDDLRMYYECARGSQAEPSSICSAISRDGGLDWTPEAGVRLAQGDCNFAAPRIVFLDDGRCRLYCLERGQGIVSALSEDSGLTFLREPGLRIAQDSPWDAQAAFAPEIVRLERRGYVMYYAGYSAPNRASILRATSDDGLEWEKESDPVLAPGHGPWDRAKCSEMCLLQLPPRGASRPVYRMLYEACDGTAPDERGVWRIAGATSTAATPSSNSTTGESP